MAEELSGGLRSQLHVIRTVRRSQFFGREVGSAGITGDIDPTALAASGLSIATTALALGPEAAAALGAVLAITIGVSATSQYIVDGNFILPNPQTGTTYSDQVRRYLLERVYGKTEGEKLWNYEFGSRQTEVDLRSRYPG